MIHENSLKRLGFEYRGINGYSRLISCDKGDPVELYVDYDGYVSLCQSNSEDHVTITSRTYGTVEELTELLVALGLPSDNGE